jgi:hypothetical protein
MLKGGIQEYKFLYNKNYIKIFVYTREDLKWDAPMERHLKS